MYVVIVGVAVSSNIGTGRLSESMLRRKGDERSGEAKGDNQDGDPAAKHESMHGIFNEKAGSYPAVDEETRFIRIGGERYRWGRS